MINGRVLDTMHQRSSANQSVDRDFRGSIRTLDDILTIDKLARIQAQKEVAQCLS